MASKSSTVTTLPKPRKARVRKPNAYLADINGVIKPTLVIAYTQADAMTAIVKLRAATHSDLMAAGKNDWPQIDTTENLPVAE
jgi:hypothetical protein